MQRIEDRQRVLVVLASCILSLFLTPLIVASHAAEPVTVLVEASQQSAGISTEEEAPSPSPSQLSSKQRQQQRQQQQLEADAAYARRLAEMEESAEESERLLPKQPSWQPAQ